jgi:hypothetical protein
LAAALEYVCAEVLKLTGNGNKDRIHGFSDPDLTSAEEFEQRMAEEYSQVESEVAKKERSQRRLERGQLVQAFIMRREERASLFLVQAFTLSFSPRGASFWA